MKKLLYSIIVCMFFACSSVPEPIPELITVEDFTKTYVGTIDAKYPIVMKLTSDEGAISGTYFYNSNGTNMILSGTLDTSGVLQMDEINDKGKKTGAFTGQITDAKISGKWVSADLSKVLNFDLMETTGDYDAIQEKTLQANGAKSLVVSGDYGVSDDGVNHSKLTIKKLSATKFSFHITVGNEWCDGDLEGEVTINENGEGFFSIESCENLTFRVKKDGIEIEEKVSCEYHGARCEFNGFYRRES